MDMDLTIRIRVASEASSIGQNNNLGVLFVRRPGSIEMSPGKQCCQRRALSLLVARFWMPLYDHIKLAFCCLIILTMLHTTYYVPDIIEGVEPDCGIWSW